MLCIKKMCVLKKIKNERGAHAQEALSLCTLPKQKHLWIVDVCRKRRPPQAKFFESSRSFSLRLKLRNTYVLNKLQYTLIQPDLFYYNNICSQPAN